MPQAFLSMNQLREAAGRTSSKVLPDEVAETFPVVTRAYGDRGAGALALVLYYRMVGPPPNGTPTLPTHAMLLDPVTGAVVSFKAVQPEDVGVRPPLDPVPGVHADMSDMTAYLARRRRFFEISPDVWLAFARGGASVDATTAAKVREYWDLFRQVVHESIAPYYTHAARDFFDWVRAVAGAP